jgi:hypothetical protein
MVTPFVPGQTIAWRNCARDASGRHEPSYAAAMRVVRDGPHDLALYRAPGYPMGRRNADLLQDVPFRHLPVIRYLDGWRSDPAWGHWHVLLLMNPDAHHAISLFWDAATGGLDFWYVDLIGPAQRRPFGFDFVQSRRGRRPLSRRRTRRRGPHPRPLDLRVLANVAGADYMGRAIYAQRVGRDLDPRETRAWRHVGARPQGPLRTAAREAVFWIGFALPGPVVLGVARLALVVNACFALRRN